MESRGLTRQEEEVPLHGGGKGTMPKGGLSLEDLTIPSEGGRGGLDRLEETSEPPLKPQ